MTEELNPEDLDPVFEVTKHLRDELFPAWRYHCDRPPQYVDTQFDFELSLHLTTVFRRLVKATLSRLSDEAENVARAKFYGFRLRDILDHVRNSKNLKYNEKFVHQLFLNFENDVKSRLNLDIGFSIPQNSIDNTAKVIKMPRVEKNIDNMAVEDRKIFARKELNFLREDRGNGPIMEVEDYTKLLDYVDDMLTKKSTIEVPEPLPHINQNKVPMKYVRFAFSNINYNCFKGKQDWIIKSFVSIFELDSFDSIKGQWKTPPEKPLR